MTLESCHAVRHRRIYRHIRYYIVLQAFILPYKTLPVSPVFKKNINWSGVVTGYKKAGYFFRRESELRFNSESSILATIPCGLDL